MIVAVILLALGGLTHAALSFAGETEIGAGTALSFGYLMLTAYFVGNAFAAARLPRLTGYLVTGLVAGPGGLGLVPEGALDNLKLSSGIAVALIALTAGTELELRSLRPLFRTVACVGGAAIASAVVLLAGAVLALSGQLPFMSGLDAPRAIAVAVVLGVVMAAQSPAVVVALRTEMASDGPVSRTVLGVVVLGDLVVILLFAVASTGAKAVFGVGADAGGTLANLAWEVFGSLGAGAAIGVVIAIYLWQVPSGAGLFVLTTCFLVAEVGSRLRFDPLLVALAAGVLIRNATGMGERLHAEIEASSLPVYVVFFAVAGASIHLGAIAVIGLPAVVLVAVRATGLLGGAKLGAKLANAPPSVRRWAGFGLLPQAGLALALATLFRDTFPELGGEASALTLAVVALNEMVAPVVHRYAIVKSGEAGALRTAPAHHAAATPAPGAAS